MFCHGGTGATRFWVVVTKHFNTWSLKVKMNSADEEAEVTVAFSRPSPFVFLLWLTLALATSDDTFRCGRKQNPRSVSEITIINAHCVVKENVAYVLLELWRWLPQRWWFTSKQLHYKIRSLSTVVWNQLIKVKDTHFHIFPPISTTCRDNQMKFIKIL